MPAQNSKRTAVPGRPFKKGQSGNPGGRPKGLGEEIRKRLGESGKKLVDAHEAIAFANAEWLAAHDYEVPSNLERQKSLDWLADRGWGKAPQALELTGQGGGPVSLVQCVIVDAASQD